jgi:hypothetical protein
LLPGGKIFTGVDPATGNIIRENNNKDITGIKIM